MRAKWSHVAIALAVIAALAIASPVFGISTSIKKAIKKEVSKQVSKATGPAGPPGANGTKGADGTARAYGRVSSLGALSRSKNVASVTKPDTGIYCITLAAGIDPSTTVMVVGPDSSDNETNTGASADESYAEWVSQGTDCPAGALEVFTYLYDGDGTDNDNGGGNTAGDNLAYDDESFSFLVP